MKNKGNVYAPPPVEDDYCSSAREEFIAGVAADTAVGLTEEEARARLEKYGPNAFEKQKKRSILKLILSQFKDVSAIILIIAAAKCA